ncbi:hypothetical protein ACH4UY_08605 [Streptomyces longwoodensis]|uniref:hypothetical protein n=1 Tax=Streptomyces longwoodensis TaxID=68231 RepID=UPI00378EBFA4
MIELKEPLAVAEIRWLPESRGGRSGTELLITDGLTIVAHAIIRELLPVGAAASP